MGSDSKCADGGAKLRNNDSVVWHGSEGLLERTFELAELVTLSLMIPAPHYAIASGIFDELECSAVVTPSWVLAVAGRLPRGIQRLRVREPGFIRRTRGQPSRSLCEVTLSDACGSDFDPEFSSLRQKNKRNPAGG